VPEAAKARGRKGADSQKQNLKVRGVHSVFTAQRYQKWLKTGVVARPKQIDLLHPKEMVRLRTNCENKIFRHILVPGNANHDSHRFLGADK
jgi:hypothetical protein